MIIAVSPSLPVESGSPGIPPTSRAALSVTDLTLGYGLSTVIHGISFQVQAEEVVAIMGRNGMGKSTLIKALVGLLPCRQGSIRLDGQELNGLAPYERIAHGVGFVPQGRMIFPALTVTENIQAGARGTISPDTWSEIYSLFPVLRDMRKRKGGNLSGGQQQQLAIARALVSNPSLLLLDEPTEGIQPSIIKDLARSLREIRSLRKLAIVVTEQVVSFMMDVCDRALVLERGRIIHEAPRRELDPAKIKTLLSV